MKSNNLKDVTFTIFCTNVSMSISLSECTLFFLSVYSLFHVIVSLSGRSQIESPLLAVQPRERDDGGDKHRPVDGQHQPNREKEPNAFCCFFCNKELSNIRYQVSGIKYQVSGIKYQVSSIKYQVSSIRYLVSHIRYQVLSISYHVSGITY